MLAFNGAHSQDLWSAYGSKLQLRDNVSLRSFDDKPVDVEVSEHPGSASTRLPG